eukprot:762210-Amphidinium_carterae.1
MSVNLAEGLAMPAQHVTSRSFLETAQHVGHRTITQTFPDGIDMLRGQRRSMTVQVARGMLFTP